MSANSIFLLDPLVSCSDKICCAEWMKCREWLCDKSWLNCVYVFGPLRDGRAGASVMPDRKWPSVVGGISIGLFLGVSLLGIPLVSSSRVRTSAAAYLAGYELEGEGDDELKAQPARQKLENQHHEHADHGVELSISPQARKSIGLREGPVSVRPYSRPIIVPGIIVEKPGRSQYTVIAPVAGCVTQVYQTPGESVSPGDPLFELRLIHEELVQLQVEFLATAEAIDVAQRELRRLEGINTEGLIAKKRILDQQYELQKLEGRQLAQRQALLLHGVSESQVNTIQESRDLLGSIIVRAPHEAEFVIDDVEGQPALLLQKLDVVRGQYVETGGTLAVLVDHRTLMIDAEASEKDAIEISEAVSEGRSVVAVLEAASGESKEISGLTIDYLSAEFDPEARTLHFFVSLLNEKLSEPSNQLDLATLNWRYRPGQQVYVRVPTDEWAERTVVPATAVAKDGGENYVFVVHGDHFHRQTVKVEFRDLKFVVLADDESIHPGDIIALTSAQQLQFAWKNQLEQDAQGHVGSAR